MSSSGSWGQLMLDAWWSYGHCWAEGDPLTWDGDLAKGSEKGGMLRGSRRKKACLERGDQSPTHLSTQEGGTGWQRREVVGKISSSLS